MKRKRNLALAAAGVFTSSTMLCPFGEMLFRSTVTDQPVSTWSSKDMNLTTPEKQSSHCETLISHSSGQWLHLYAPISMNTLDASVANSFYFTDEVYWLQGKNMPSRFDLQTCKTKYENQRSSKIYVSKLGNQCGCGLKEFVPSISRWIYNKNETIDQSKLNETYHGVFSSIRLAQNLGKARAHLCFVGDSVDYEFYDALKTNLQRTLKLQKLGHAPYNDLIDFINERIIPVNTSRAENGVKYVPPGWQQMTNVEETEVKFLGSNATTKFSYFKHYGWSPWDFEILEDCNIVVMNLSLHYYFKDSRSKFFGNKLFDDVRAAITSLVNFTTSKSRHIAVWRSALPQHFPTPSGHHDLWLNYGKNKNYTCAPIKGSYRDQVYNIIHDEAFDDLCSRGSFPKSSCSAFERNCTVNIREMAYQTVYQFRKSRNLKTWVDEHDDPMRIGVVLRWLIADLFDNYLWHPENRDCSHYCYVPQLFDAAFHRMALLLGERLKKLTVL